MYVFIIISGILFLYIIAEKLYNKKKKTLLNKIKNLNIEIKTQQNILNDLLIEEKELSLKKEEQLKFLNDLKETIQKADSTQREVLKKSFEQYVEILENNYKEKEREYDILIDKLNSSYDTKHIECINLYNDFQNKIQLEKEQCINEINKIKAIKNALVEAQLREEEIQTKRDFYSLQIDDTLKKDISILLKIKSELKYSRPLLMAIWEGYYQDAFNSLVSRVLKTNKKVTGIYKITSKDGKIYIGQAQDIKERWRTHFKNGLGIDTPAGNLLYKQMQIDGIETFTFEVLEVCPSKELNEKETYYIDLYQAYNYGFNKTKGARNEISKYTSL